MGRVNDEQWWQHINALALASWRPLRSGLSVCFPNHVERRTCDSRARLRSRAYMAVASLFSMGASVSSTSALRTIASGLLHDGLSATHMTPKGKQEVREAVDALLDLSEQQRGKIDEPYLVLLSDGQAVCIGGKWNGWKFWKHPDGRWVSIKKLPQEALPPELNRVLSP
jgi:hypothetical protein